ncbi:MAG: ABC transporter [Peptoanaerobacter stomatis]|uniref:ABC transporter n=1 Tax=Peptoanaerobacter stomatis TaxID=796937 RepID=UPI003F9F9FDE
MINTLCADLYRIAHKKKNYLFFLILTLLFTTVMLSGSLSSSSAEEQPFSPYMVGVASSVCTNLGVILLSINSFIVIYCDDINSGYIKQILSKSSDRTYYIVSKLISLIIYLFFAYLFLGAVFFAEFYIFSKGFYSNIAVYIDVLKLSIKTGLVSYIITAVYTLEGAVILYFTSKTDIALGWLCLSTTRILTNVLYWISQIVKFLKPFLNITVDSIAGNALENGIISLKFLIGVSLYILSFIVIQIFFINTRELKID